MEEFFDIIIALAAIGAVIIRIAKKAQEKIPHQQTTFEESEDTVEEEPIFKSEPFNRTTRSTEYAKNKDVFVSFEGSESYEGKCIEPDADHCAVEHVDDVFQTEISEETPVRFNREALIQGIIMSEILSKPKWKE